MEIENINKDLLKSQEIRLNDLIVTQVPLTDLAVQSQEAKGQIKTNYSNLY